MKKKEKEQQEERERLKSIYGKDSFARNLFARNNFEKVSVFFKQMMKITKNCFEFSEANPELMKKVKEFSKKVKQNQEKENNGYHI